MGEEAAFILGVSNWCTIKLQGVGTDRKPGLKVRQGSIKSTLVLVLLLLLLLFM